MCYAHDNVWALFNGQVVDFNWDLDILGLFGVIWLLEYKFSLECVSKHGILSCKEEKASLLNDILILQLIWIRVLIESWIAHYWLVFYTGPINISLEFASLFIGQTSPVQSVTRHLAHYPALRSVSLLLYLRWMGLIISKELAIYVWLLQV